MLNKKLCREYAAPGASMSPGSGIFYARQIDYLVQTAVKIIDHQRVLVLYIYRREDAAHGNLRPLWTMFHSRDDYITLARQPDGSVKWRTASFENLGEDYHFTDQCAFYSAGDRRRLSRYFHTDEKSYDETGFSPLIRAQSTLLEQRLKVREKARAHVIHDRMKVLPALPAGLEVWAHRAIMPAYFFYDYRKGARSVTGLCTACGHEITLDRVKHNMKTICPRCGRELTMKSRGRRGRFFDRDTCQVVQRTGPDELVIRIIKVTYLYETDMPQECCKENARVFVRRDESGAVLTEPYFYAYSDKCWKKGFRPVYYKYSYNFEADDSGHVYCGNLPKALKGTPWQYCPIALFYNSDHERMQMAPFLQAYLEHPRLEHLIKTGFYALVSDLVYREADGSHLLDETQNRTHRILRVAAEDTDYLRELNVKVPVLRAFQDYCERGVKDRQKLLSWQLGNGVARDLPPILEHTTAHKLMRYVDGQYAFLQYRKDRYQARRYRNTQSVVSEYRDYLEMCVKQRYDMRNSFVLFPKDLQKSHDRVAHRIKLKADAQMRRDFQAAYERIMNRLDYEYEGLKIVYPAAPEDIIQEGNALHHCVGGYVDRVAKRECMILFLRRCGDEAKPYYTVEVRERKAVQVRGMNNEDATPEVRRFIQRWEQEVLQVPAHKAA